MSFDSIVRWLKEACPSDFAGDVLTVSQDDETVVASDDGRYRVVISSLPASVSAFAAVYNAAAPGGLQRRVSAAQLAAAPTHLRTSLM
jgi:hypothetical protein